MSLKSFMNKPKRNGFDLSFKNAFTAKAGELLPVMCKEVLPGDKFKISSQSFTRTQPLLSPAYVRMREYYDVVFVPYRLLWNRFPQFFTNLPDFHHAASISSKGSTGDVHPYFTYNDISGYLERSSNGVGPSPTPDGSAFKNFFGFNRYQLSMKLLHFLGYGNIVPGFIRDNDLVFNPCPLLAYQKICQDLFRDDQWEQAAPYRYNLDYITTTDDVHIPVDEIDTTQLNMFDMCYCNYPKDYFMGMLPASQYGDEAFVPIGGSGGATGGTYDVDFGTSSVNLSEGKVVDGYMIDGSDSTPSGSFQEVLQNAPYSTAAPGNNVISPFQPAVDDPQAVLFYKNAEAGHDYRPRVPMGAVNLSGSQLSQIGAQVTINGGTGSVDGSLSILALRQAEALQKWKEIAQSGRQDYRTQMQKHFGVTPSEAMADHVRYLGGWSNNIDINEVVNQNLAAENSQADLMGKGVGTAGGSVDCDFKEHGLLFVMYHCLPLLDYSTNGVKKLNLKSNYTDYAIPEFDSIGMQSLNSIELGTSVKGSATDDEFNNMGYVPRYADYKTSYDEVHGAFASSLAQWVAPLDNQFWLSYITRVTAVYGSPKIVYEFFKVNPSILDNLFGVNAGSTDDTDQFLVNAFFDVKVVRNLDYNGLPY